MNTKLASVASKALGPQLCRRFRQRYIFLLEKERLVLGPGAVLLILVVSFSLDAVTRIAS
jgi:hypothetical protein